MGGLSRGNVVTHSVLVPLSLFGDSSMPKVPYVIVNADSVEVYKLFPHLGGSDLVGGLSAGIAGTHRISVTCGALLAVPLAASPEVVARADRARDWLALLQDVQIGRVV